MTPRIGIVRLPLSIDGVNIRQHCWIDFDFLPNPSNTEVGLGTAKHFESIYNALSKLNIDTVRISEMMRTQQS